MRAWLSNQATLVALLAEVEAERDRLAATLRRANACHQLELQMRDADVAACRREAESLDAGNQTLIEQIRWADVVSSRQAHRIAAAYRFADQLSPDVAAELRGRLALTFPPTPEEASRAG
ncbi:hypothetical protein AB0K35_28435 [Micromonospora sp. NPDC053740]|uniref:hypothetical protein n=1 Tax=Micromonospora sp. NPDC053740 TaxID=3155173 RepID=UPI0034349759